MARSVSDQIQKRAVDMVSSTCDQTIGAVAPLTLVRRTSVSQPEIATAYSNQIICVDPTGRGERSGQEEAAEAGNRRQPPTEDMALLKKLLEQMQREMAELRGQPQSRLVFSMWSCMNCFGWRTIEEQQCSASCSHLLPQY
jgi:hypothetical protein